MSSGQAPAWAAAAWSADSRPQTMLPVFAYTDRPAKGGS